VSEQAVSTEFVTTGLTVRYGKSTAVEQVDLRLRKGTLTVLLGLNGAGKSSLLRALIGLVPSDGEVAIGKFNVSKLPAHRRVGKGISFLPEGRGVFPSLTVEQNIMAGCLDSSLASEVLDDSYALFSVLADRRRQVAGTLSGGEQQMLSIARCMAARPRVMLLDEVSLGLSPIMVQQIYTKLDELRSRGVTLLVVEQFAHAALSIADDAGVLVRGALTSYGPASDVAALSASELGDLMLAAR
jgi:branched-chain amino acid transport system ATP-binding protein